MNISEARQLLGDGKLCSASIERGNGTNARQTGYWLTAVDNENTRKVINSNRKHSRTFKSIKSACIAAKDIGFEYVHVEL